MSRGDSSEVSDGEGAEHFEQLQSRLEHCKMRLAALLQAGKWHPEVS